MAAEPKPPWKRLPPRPPVPAPKTSLVRLEARMAEIAAHHHKDIDRVGGSWGVCVECGHSWPCPTFVWATEERDPYLSPWDPADDVAEDNQQSQLNGHCAEKRGRHSVPRRPAGPNKQGKTFGRTPL